MDSLGGHDDQLMPENKVEARERPTTDLLTGLPTLRGAEESIARELSQARRHKTPFSCIVFDIERFIDVNLHYGYVVGDRILCEIGALLQRKSRAQDIAIRLGGDEFLIILPDADGEQAQRVATRVVHSVEALTVEGIPPITATAGVAASTLGERTDDWGSEEDFIKLLRDADVQLYRAKAAKGPRSVSRGYSTSVGVTTCQQTTSYVDPSSPGWGYRQQETKETMPTGIGSEPRSARLWAVRRLTRVAEG